jgi:phage shock protein B
MTTGLGIGAVGIIGFTAVVLVFVTIFGVVGLVCWMIVRLVSGGGRGKAQGEASRAAQELYQGLARMEERVEALETLLLERDRKGERRS